MIENSLIIIIGILKKECSILSLWNTDDIYNYAIGIEHYFYELFNKDIRKYLDYLDLYSFVMWNIEQLKLGGF